MNCYYLARVLKSVCCLGVDDSSLEELNESLVTETCKREFYQLNPRSDNIFEQSSGTSIEILSAEASKQDHSEIDRAMELSHPIEDDQQFSACEKGLGCIQEPSQVNISAEKPEIAEGLSKPEQYITPLNTVQHTEKNDVFQRSLVGEIRETEIQLVNEGESEQSLLPEISSDPVQFADGNTGSGNTGEEPKPTNLTNRLAILADRLQVIQQNLQRSSYSTPVRNLKPSKGSESAKRVRETISVRRSRLSVKSDKEAFMKDNPNDFTQQLKSLAKEKETKPKDFEKLITKRAALKNLSSNAMEQRAESVGKPFPSEEKDIHNS